jgi:hypothetical protein
MRNPIPSLTRLCLCCAAAGTILHAGQPRLGLTAGAAWPTGATRDTTTDTTGFNLGAYADWERSPGHTLRLALDGIFNPGSALGDLGTGQGRSEALTLNYLFTPRADLTGFHVILGAGAMNVQRKSGDTLHETGLKLAWNAGFGIHFNENWGFLARYLQVQDNGRNLGMLTTGLAYRF